MLRPTVGVITDFGATAGFAHMASVVGAIMVFAAMARAGFMAGARMACTAVVGMVSMVMVGTANFGATVMGTADTAIAAIAAGTDTGRITRATAATGTTTRHYCSPARRCILLITTERVARPDSARRPLDDAARRPNHKAPDVRGLCRERIVAGDYFEPSLS